MSSGELFALAVFDVFPLKKQSNLLVKDQQGENRIQPMGTIELSFIQLTALQQVTTGMIKGNMHEIGYTSLCDG